MKNEKISICVSFLSLTVVILMFAFQFREKSENFVVVDTNLILKEAIAEVVKLNPPENEQEKLAQRIEQTLKNQIGDLKVEKKKHVFAKKCILSEVDDETARILKEVKNSIHSSSKKNGAKNEE